MEGEINSVMIELFLIILKIAGPLAGLRLAIAGLKTLAGDSQSAVESLRQVGLGLFIILTSQTIVYFIEQFATAVAVIRQGW